MVAQKASLADPELQAAVLKLGDWRWRINNLYRIEDKAGKVIRFKMNKEQEDLFDNMHYLNIVLKARQLGFSTFILIFMLDACLFNSNTSCGVIDATLSDAKKKLNKIKFAYDGLPTTLKHLFPITKSNETEIQFSNRSGVIAGTSHRGGTLQYLHISEFGKICAKTPMKATEIVTGALNTIAAGQVCFIESTAEGQAGRFYEFCQAAQAKMRAGEELTLLDFKFFFYPWWGRAEYELDPKHVVINHDYERYFKKLVDEFNIELNNRQKAWYVKKAEVMADDMKREYPATPEEAFEASVEGSILGPMMEAAELEGRVGDYPAVEGIPVNTFWDIGRKDYTTIWFVQSLFGENGTRLRVVGYYQHCMTGMPHYAKICDDLYKEKGWVRGDDYYPHDAKVIEWGSDKSRIEQLEVAGFNPKLMVRMSLHDGINASRATIKQCEFDKEGCEVGIKVLKNYKWKWNEALGCFDTQTPTHDDNSHGADGFRTLATSWREIVPTIEPKHNPTELTFEADEHGKLHSSMSVMDLVKAKERKRKRR